MKNADKPIHPSSIKESYDLMGHEMFRTVNNKGLTKREYFAGLFLQGLLSNSYFPTVATIEEFPQKAISIADSFLKQLETTQD